jgi:uncharacterized protein with HEPN domain
MAGMRNILAHEYFGVRMGIIWKTLKERLPELQQTNDQNAQNSFMRLLTKCND